MTGRRRQRDVESQEPAPRGSLAQASLSLGSLPALPTAWCWAAGMGCPLLLADCFKRFYFIFLMV